MQSINWPTSLFLLLTPVAALVWGGLYVHEYGVGTFEIVLFTVLFFATGMSITAGYHRLWAHRAFDCHWSIKLPLALLGAATFQHSVLTWCSDHRRHHKHIDHEEDPYNIRKGFFWAHIGWLLVNDLEGERFENVRDLSADPILRWQHRYYMPIAAVMCFGVPTLIGWAFGSPWGGLLWGGVVRVVAVHHITFLVNSLAHTLGSRPYTLEVSARDSLVTALLTFGEGYHNYHHRFAADYRNGVRAHQYDPTKWMIRTLAALGLAWDLRRVPRERIVAARVATEKQRLLSGLLSCPEQLAAALRARCTELAEALERSAERLGALEREWSSWGRDQRRKMESMRAELRQARREFRAAHRTWRETLLALRGEALPVPA